MRNGLGDREESVKKAAAQLLAVWVDVVRSDGSRAPKEEEETKKERGAETIVDLVAFLNLFDLTEGTVAEDALGSVFDTRIDIFEHIEFSGAFALSCRKCGTLTRMTQEDYWTDLTPERAFLARVFVDKCIAKDMRLRIDESLPVTTHMMFRIQGVYNQLVEHIQADTARQNADEDEDEDAYAAREEARLDLELTVAELLRLAVNLDYGDEMGRRKMFMLVRGMLAQEFLSEELLARPLDVLRVLMENEKDLIRVAVEVVHELRDPPSEEGEGEVKAEEATMDADADETMTEMGTSPNKVKPQKAVEELTPEQKARRDTVDLRCLSLCIGMLERVNSVSTTFFFTGDVS